MTDNNPTSNLTKKQLHSLRMKKGWETRKKNLAKQKGMFGIPGTHPVKSSPVSEPREIAIKLFRYVLATRITGDTSLLNSESFRSLEQQFIKHYRLTPKEFTSFLD